MPNVRPRFSSRSIFNLAAAFVLTFLIFGSPSARAQNATNILSWAKAAEIVMETETSATFMIIRTGSTEGKLQVSVGFTNSGTNIVIPTNWIAPTVTFSNYQMSAKITVPITNSTATKTLPPATLYLTNAAVAPGENTNYLPVIPAAGAKMLVTAIDVNAANIVSILKMNTAVSEGGTVRVPVSISGSLDPSSSVAVDYAIEQIQPSEVAAGADFATVSKDVDGGSISGTLTFTSQAPTQFITVPTLADSEIEFDEEFKIHLLKVTGDNVVPGVGTNAPTTNTISVNGQDWARGRILFNGSTNSPQSAGSVDQLWNSNSNTNRNPGANGPVSSVLVDPQTGKTYVAGNFTSINAEDRVGIGRLNPDGTVDTSFRPPGGADDTVTTMKLYDDSFGANAGKLLIGGAFTSVNGDQYNSIARLNDDGTTDTTFNSQAGAGADGPVYALALETDGGIIVGGDFTSVDGIPRSGIARLQPDGKLDLNTFQAVNVNGPVFGLALQGTLLPDITFGASAANSTNVNTSIPITVPAKLSTLSLQYQNNGMTNRFRIVFGGNVIANTVLQNPTKITANQDGSFTTNYVATNISYALGPLSTGTNILTVQVTPLGTNDTGELIPASWNYTATVSPSGGNRVIAVGDFTSANGQSVSGVARFLPDGTLDPVFQNAVGSGANGSINAISAQSDGKLILGGSFTSFNNRTAGGIVRLLAEGGLDSAFSSGFGANGSVLSIAIGEGDVIYLGGEFTSVNRTRRVFLARLLKDGPVDTSFMDTAYNQFAGFPSLEGFSPDGFVTSVALNSTNVVVGGLFDLVGGGPTRASAIPRHNFAQVVGGETPGPGNIQFGGDLFGVNENDGSRVTVLNRVNGSLGPVLATLATADAAATADEDYVPVAGTVGFNSGSLTPSSDFTVSILDDTKLEGNEDLLVNLVGLASGLTLGGEPIPLGVAFEKLVQSRILIFDDDRVDAVFSFAKPEYNADENTGPDENHRFATIEVYRTGNTADRVTVTYVAKQATGSNAATDGVDFNSVTNVLVFSAGQTNRTFQVKILDDVFTEADEIVNLSLIQPRGGAVIDTNAANATLFIVDNDLPSGKVDFSLGAYAVTEGQSNIVVEVQRSGGNVDLISVDYTTVDGTALAGADYLPVSGTLTWNNQDISTKRITIPIIDNAAVEALENFKLILTNASKPGIIGTRHAETTVSIRDNDFFGDLAFGAPEFFADENGVSAVIQVVRRNGIADQVSVDYKTAPGTAAANVDYQDVSGTLTFAAGQTALSFVVPIIDNTNQNGNRTIRLFLTNAVQATLIGQTNATLTIVDNESFNIPGGDVQRDFSTGDGANARVNSVLLQNDGPTNALRKIVLAGQFTQFDHVPRQHVVRLNDNGTLDLSYAEGLAVDGDVNATLVTGSRLVIGGNFANIDGTRLNRLARLNSIGRRDTSFDIGSGANGPILALGETFVASGTNRLSRIIVGGEFFSFAGQSRNRIAVLMEDGSLDPQFLPGEGPDKRVTALAAQRDGKIVIAGDFTNVAGFSRPHIARLNADGSIDTTFDPGIGVNGAVRSVAIQADDKILVGGDFTQAGGQDRARIARFNVDGNLDPSFDPGTGADAAVYSIGLQSDGSIILGGDFNSVNGITRPKIARLLPNGQLDLNINFGTGADKLVASVVVQYDRKIVIGGDFTVVNGFPQVRVARIFGGSLAGSGRIEFAVSDTSVSESVGSAQVIVQRFGGTEGTATATVYTVAESATPDQDYQNITNNLVFGPGEAYRTVNIPIIDDNLGEGPERVLLVLTNVTGAVIGRQPIAHLEIISDDTVISFDKPIYRGSEITGVPNRVDVGLVRTGDMGSTVTVTVKTQGGGTATSGSDFQASTNIVIFTPGETRKTVPITILDDTIGEGDESFTLNLSVTGAHAYPGIGVATFIIEDNDIARGIFTFEAAAITFAESSGTNFITIRRTSGSQENVAVTVTTTAGTAQTNDFIGFNGVVNFAPGQTEATIPIVIIDDQFVEAPETFRITLSNPSNGSRLGTNPQLTITIGDDDLGPGSLDQSFDPGTGANGTNKSVYSILLQPDGKIVVGGGFTQFSGGNAPRLIRLETNGAPDASFSAGLGPLDVVYSLSPAGGGKITVGGAFRSFNAQDKLYVARILSGGSLDPAMTQSAELNGPVRSVAGQSDTKILIGGEFTSPANRAGRINASGSLDVSFNTGAGADGVVYDEQVTADNKVIIGGSFQNVGGLPRNGVARLLENGLIDPSFNSGAGPNGIVYRVMPLSSRKVLIAGDFTAYGTNNVNRLARLNEDGTLDTNFNIGTGFNGVIYALTLESPTKLLVAGDFTVAEDQTLTRIARINLEDGSLDSSFTPTLSVNGAIRDIEVQPDGKILIAGDFTQVNGFNRGGVARLNGRPVIRNIAITSVLLDAGALVLTFESQSGVDYEVQYTSDFATWTTLKTVTASGNITTVNGIPIEPGNRFFRVVRP